jgi:hypothetical protein
VRSFLCALLLAAFPITGHSSTFEHPHFVTYSLRGSALTGCHEGTLDFAVGPCPSYITQDLPMIGALDGNFTIDEYRLGRTLISASIELGLPSTSFEGPDNTPIRSPGDWEAIISSTLGLPILDVCCGGSFRLETDSQRRPISWAFDLLGGPPDWGTSSGGLSYIDVPGGATLTGPSGVLRLEGIAPIPLPPAAVLLAVGLLGLGVISRRKRRSGGQ